jgi:hypothetical protein
VVPKVVVTTDPLFVDGDSLVKPRRRFAGHRLYPDGLEAKGAGGEAARGYPAPMLRLGVNFIFFFAREGNLQCQEVCMVGLFWHFR